MRFQAGIQITLLLVAIIIAFSVIKPKIEAIRADQNELSSYRLAVQNIGLYNQRLQALINQSNALSAYDRAVLWRYLPEEIDATLVASDISNIVNQNRLLLLDIIPREFVPVTTETVETQSIPTQPAGAVVDVTEGTPTASLMSQQFEVEAVGTYEQMKSMLQDFERNAYPLRLVEFSFELEEAGSTLVQYSLVLETYALPAS